jgi:hypothetical protein
MSPLAMLASGLADVATFARAMREHWGVENQPHWVLDVQLNEDQSRGARCPRQKTLGDGAAWDSTNCAATSAARLAALCLLRKGGWALLSLIPGQTFANVSAKATAFSIAFDLLTVS